MNFGSWIKNIKHITRRIQVYVPITIYFIIFAILSWGAFIWLQQQQQLSGTSYHDILALLIQVAMWFIVTLLMLSFLSVFLPFLLLLQSRRKKKIHLRVSSDDSQLRKENAGQVIKISLHPVWKPFLGFVKLQLYYDQNNISEKFAVIENRQHRFFSSTLEGVSHWPILQIKEYTIHKAVIRLEDYFQFFSLSAHIDCNDRFHIAPLQKDFSALNVSPRKTEDPDVRIEELKKVEGEYLHYKHFENNDDVRRIVWKIYAKTKTLVVRNPEILDPYASHVHFYASFHSAYNVQGSDVIDIPFLNFYKTVVWNAYKQLQRKNFEVRYISELTAIHAQQPATEDIGVQYLISKSAWQQEFDLHSYIKAKEASIVIISSLNDIAEVTKLVEQCGDEIMIVFVQLTKSVRGQHIGDWLKWVFVQSKKDVYSVYKTKWRLSTWRNTIKNNEKQLKKLLETREKSVVI